MSQDPPEFTREQGQVLAFIYNYHCIAGRAPTELEVQQYFAEMFHGRTTLNFIYSLEQAGYVSRVANIARSIKLLVKPESLPMLLAGRPIKLKVRGQ